MSEIEVSLEQIQEDINHAAHHAEGPVQKLMTMGAALSAMLAVLAAVSALFAGHFANEAMIDQIKSSDHWSYYQAKGIKLAITEFRHESAQGEKDFSEKIEAYKKDQEEIKKQAEEKQKESEAYLKKHESLATAVTFFQVAIALTAIAVLTRKRRYLMGASVLGAVGVVFILLTWI